MRARYFKIGLWVVALVAVWNLGQSYTLTNALLLFAADGVVPGTNTVLQPDQVFWLLGIVLVLAIGLIFATNIRRTVRRWTGRAPGLLDLEPEPEFKAEVAAKVAEESPTPAPAVRLPRKPLALELALRRVAIRAMVLAGSAGLYATERFPHFAAALRKASSALAAKLRLLAENVRKQLHVVWSYLRPALQRGTQALRHGLIRLLIVIGRAVRRARRWTEPRLRHFDAWLGVQFRRGLSAVRRSETYRDFIRYSRETGRSTVWLYEQVRARLRFTPPAEK